MLYGVPCKGSHGRWAGSWKNGLKTTGINRQQKQRSNYTLEKLRQLTKQTLQKYTSAKSLPITGHGNTM